MEWYIKVLSNYATFTGRARRKEFWMFCLISSCISISVSIFGAVVDAPFFSSIYSLCILLPGIGLYIRRMHDLDRSGGWACVPIYNIVLCCTEGTKGTNQYGPDPKPTTVTPAKMALLVAGRLDMRLPWTRQAIFISPAIAMLLLMGRRCMDLQICLSANTVQPVASNDGGRSNPIFWKFNTMGLIVARPILAPHLPA
jgi:uncharacterized membrane protein YhaH (DUF805 family)